MRFISYSQEFEDLIIYNALKDYVTNGFYIDIGANDPVNLSVTKAFYERGWHGINIEPLDDMCRLLCLDRERDINLCVGIGSEKGYMNLALAEMGSSFADEVQANMSDDVKYVQKPIITLKDVIDTYCEPKQEIHFCKIDVEGFEREVLLGADFSTFRPWIIIMEATEPGTTIPCHEKWESILLDNNYVFVFQNGINRYYVSLEKIFLKEEFDHLGYFLANNEVCISRINPVNFN